MRGSEWVETLDEKPSPKRDAAILEAVRNADFVLTGWTALKLQVPDGRELIIFVTDDAMRFGNADDSVRFAVSARVAQQIDDELQCIMPTPLISDVRWLTAKHRLELVTQSPNPGGTKAGIMKCHRELDKLLVGKSGLAAPISKNHVLDEELWNGRERFTAIYGLQSSTSSLARSAGAIAGVKVVQGLYDSDGDGDGDAYDDHVLDFVDYYTEFQWLLTRACLLDGRVDDLARIYQDPELAPAVNHDGALPGYRHPGVELEALDSKPLRLPDDIVPPPHDTLPGSPPRPVVVARHQLGARLLRLGLSGDDVGVWKDQLERDGHDVSDDDYFDRGVHNATISWQSQRRDPDTGEWLTKDGIVGPASLRAIGTRLIERDNSVDELAYIEATNYLDIVRNPLEIWWIVKHTMEAAEASTTAENVARWFGSGRRAPVASAHVCGDDDSLVQCVPWLAVGYHARGGNRYTIGEEQAGYARQTAAQWSDPFSTRMLERFAKFDAKLCAGEIVEDVEIPIRRATISDLRKGRRLLAGGKLSPSALTEMRASLGGFVDHLDISKAYGKSTHRDVGPHYPWSHVFELVRAASQ